MVTKSDPDDYVIAGVSLLVMIAMAIGACSSEPVRREQTQKCEMCGTEWMITSDEVLPPTIEWCFHDGSYCQQGLEMVIKAVEGDVDPKLSLEFINHCLKCRGCRCAAFKPEEWHPLVDAIQRMRKEEGGE